MKQGDLLSPNLFNPLLEHIFCKLDWANKGIKIDGKKSNHLRFVNDIVIMSGDREEVQEMLDGLVKESAEAGLKVNMTKTKVMCDSHGAKIRIGGIDLETVEEYTYLGQIISFKEKMGKEIERRISHAWKGYWDLKLVFKGSVKISSKIRMFEACVLPILLYGAQMWTVTKAQTRRLVTT